MVGTPRITSADRMAGTSKTVTVWRVWNERRSCHLTWQAVMLCHNQIQPYKDFRNWDCKLICKTLCI
jgi:hypothetical protein